jgi:hypothetical protein
MSSLLRVERRRQDDKGAGLWDLGVATPAGVEIPGDPLVVGRVREGGERRGARGSQCGVGKSLRVCASAARTGGRSSGARAWRASSPS